MSGLKKELLQMLAIYGNVGFTFVTATFIGLGVGVFLDRKVFAGDTSPWFTFIGLAFGIASGFKILFDIVAKTKNKDAGKDE
ncbi:MAG: AtpZ/AtpI family protein [Desulfopila sp.]